MNYDNTDNNNNNNNNNNNGIQMFVVQKVPFWNAKSLQKY